MRPAAAGEACKRVDPKRPPTESQSARGRETEQTNSKTNGSIAVFRPKARSAHGNLSAVPPEQIIETHGPVEAPDLFVYAVGS
jgi:hypothetical protein